MKNRLSRALDFAILFFILSGSLYFLYYLLQSNKPMYLLFSVLIYIISFSIRHFIIKGKNDTGFTEVGMFFVSMIFLAYTLYIFKLDQEVITYLPDKLLINSGVVFIFLLLMNLLPKRKSGRLSILGIVTLLAVFLFRDKLDLIFYTYPLVTSLIIGTPYVYLLSLLTGIQKLKATDDSR